MQIIALSSSLKTEWVIVDGNDIMGSASTDGLNPYFLSRREISHIIRLQLPETFFRRRWDHVYFYGAGCSSPEKIKIVELSLVAQFKSPTTVMSDLMGAARGLLLRDRGLVAIIATGANSCLYDGEKIVKNVRPGGYILGDEGSNSYLGKMLVADIIKGITPESLADAFKKEYDTTVDEIMDYVYSTRANIKLAEYSAFLAEHIDHPYCKNIVYSGFINFFRRNIAEYEYMTTPLAVMGSTAVIYKETFLQAARNFGLIISKIEGSAIPGLIEYHK